MTSRISARSKFSTIASSSPSGRSASEAPSPDVSGAGAVCAHAAGPASAAATLTIASIHCPFTTSSSPTVSVSPGRIAGLVLSRRRVSVPFELFEFLPHRRRQVRVRIGEGGLPRPARCAGDQTRRGTRHLRGRSGSRWHARPRTRHARTGDTGLHSGCWGRDRRRAAGSPAAGVAPAWLSRLPGCPAGRRLLRRSAATRLLDGQRQGHRRRSSRPGSRGSAGPPSGCSHRSDRRRAGAVADSPAPHPSAGSRGRARSSGRRPASDWVAARSPSPAPASPPRSPSAGSDRTDPC